MTGVPGSLDVRHDWENKAPRAKFENRGLFRSWSVPVCALVLVGGQIRLIKPRNPYCDG